MFAKRIAACKCWLSIDHFNSKRSTDLYHVITCTMCSTYILIFLTDLEDVKADNERYETKMLYTT